jgi:GABA(A) receptor-associated protein
MKAPLSKRKMCSDRILRTYPDKIPVVVDRGNKESPPIAKHKYLIKSCDEMIYLIMSIRKQILMPQDQSLFFLTEDHSIVPVTMLMGNLYQNKRNADGFLYLFYTQESTFGNDDSFMENEK